MFRFHFHTIILTLAAPSFPASFAAQKPADDIRISLTTAPRTVDGKGADAGKSFEQPKAVLKIPAVIDQGNNLILAAVFDQQITKEYAIRLKIENRSAREWSVLLVAMSPDKSCSSIIPFKAFSDQGISNDRDVPIARIAANGARESDWPHEDGEAGRQRFVAPKP